MTDISILGAGLMQHLKAYIDEVLHQSSTGGHDGIPVLPVSGREFYLDPFNAHLTPLSLPLPHAFAQVAAMLATHAEKDHVIVHVASHEWEDFYRKLLTAAREYPVFLDSAVNVQQRFGFASSPALELPSVAVILAGNGYAPINDWLGRYDQVYSAVLVSSYESGKVPQRLI